MNEETGDCGGMEIFDTRAFALDPESSQKGPTEQQCVSDYLLRTHQNYLLEQLIFIHPSIQLLVNFSTVLKLLYTEYNRDDYSLSAIHPIKSTFVCCLFS